MTHKMKRSILVFSVLFLLFGTMFSAKQVSHSQGGEIYDESWALLIGINKYKHLPPQLQLRAAVNDVTSMRQLLIDKFGFREDHIITLTDKAATKQGIENAMRKFADVEKIRKNDRVLIYFSGHGQTVTLPDGTEMGFLATHDAEIDLTDPKPNPADYYGTCVGMNRLRELSSFIPAKHVLFLVDACYSGLAVRSIRSLEPQLPNYLEKVAKLRARQIATAGLRGEQVFEERGHGLFTYKLLEALEHGIADKSPPDNVTTATELAAHLSGIVPAYTDNKQHPHFGRFDGEGEFIFQHRRTVEPPPPPTLAPAVDRERPQIKILEPAGLRNAKSFTLEAADSKAVKLVGIATDNVGVVSVRINGRLVPTTAASARSFEIVGLPGGSKGVRFETTIDLSSPLRSGLPSASEGSGEVRPGVRSEIEIQASDAAGNSAVIYPKLGIHRPDTEKPTIEITEPAGLRNAKSFQVEAQGVGAGLNPAPISLRLSGIARDNVGVTRVTVNGRAAQTTAMERGTVQFETTLNLNDSSGVKPPNNTLEIRATDAAGNLGTLIVTIETPPGNMALIPAGDFWMGSPDGEGQSDEHPRHKVYLDAFTIDKYEVTNAEFKAFIDANPQWRKDRIPSQYHDGDYLKHWNGHNFPNGKGDHPVVYVSWYAAAAYAGWAGKRLPTEAEWEKAARGGLEREKYPWGDSIDASKANYAYNVGETTPVGKYPPNRYGLYDVAGNVWEWCMDEYDSGFYAKSQRRNPISGGVISFDNNNFTNVKNRRVLRGGSWYSYDGVPDRSGRAVRVAYRFDLGPTYSNYYLGFRCASSSSISRF